MCRDILVRVDEGIDPYERACGLLCIPHDPQTGVTPLGIPFGHNPFSREAANEGQRMRDSIAVPPGGGT